MIFWDASALLNRKPLTAEHSAPRLSRSRVRVVCECWFFWPNGEPPFFSINYDISGSSFVRMADARETANPLICLSPPGRARIRYLSFANNLSAHNGLTFSAVETKNRGSCRP